MKISRQSLIVTSILLTALLGACGNSTLDKNGVPKITDAKKPVVNGQVMTPEVFYKKYCSTPETYTDSICGAVKEVVNVHSIDNPAHVKW